ncbi:FAD-binding oxidoreductase [Stappia taiwanensis]|uniref:FAD-binding oxidoreductase n=1 Tax=Stappia taiwanensis TaxID=992267 RepID=A0A838XXV2_9HYPH|nr:FAD-binding oxidoreductase [Stappia taiwanensis]MBA4611723.1 FAD-binding oxidoreductase [Stappia taiwanensis]GGE97306.1 glycerol-3-phosphate dehydrogenase [Stappia taiwanensis]
MTTTADILVIGGGIAGIGVAARLSGSASVVVLESEDVIGRHATGRSAAIFIKNYGNATLRALNAASEPLLATGGDLSDTPFLTPRGELVVATAGEEGDLESYLDGSDGLERLTPAEAVAMFPILNPEYVVAAALERAAQDIDVDRLLQAYARMARHNGARVVASAPAMNITRTGGVWQVEAGGETYAAPILVNAAGAWADTVAERAGVRPAGLVPLRRSAAILPAPEGCDVTGWPALVSASETWYAKPEAGKLMVSPADEDPVEPHDAWPEDMVLAEGLHRYEQAMTVPVTRVERSWAGLRTFTADRTPVVGFDPEADGFFWLAGQGGYGIQTSPVLSELAAALCLSQTPDLPASLLAALSPARLARA